MKRIALVTASLLLTFTGCGRGWLPFNRGASCATSSCMNAPAYSQGSEIASSNAGCNGCENVGVGYGDYPEIISDGYTHSTLPGMQQESVIGQPVQ